MMAGRPAAADMQNAAGARVSGAIGHAGVNGAHGHASRDGAQPEGGKL